MVSYTVCWFLCFILWVSRNLRRQSLCHCLVKPSGSLNLVRDCTLIIKYNGRLLSVASFSTAKVRNSSNFKGEWPIDLLKHVLHFSPSFLRTHLTVGFSFMMNSHLTCLFVKHWWTSVQRMIFFGNRDRLRSFGAVSQQLRRKSSTPANLRNHVSKNDATVKLSVSSKWIARVDA